MAVLFDPSKRWYIVLKCTICGPLGLLFSYIFTFDLWFTKAYWAHGKIFFRVITRIFRVITRMFRVITRIFRVITRIFRVITRMFRVITRMFRVITRMFRVITRIFRVITRIFDILTVAVDSYCSVSSRRLLVQNYIWKDGKLNTSIYMFTVTLLSGTFKAFNPWKISFYEHGLLTLLSFCTELKLSGSIVKVRKEMSGYLFVGDDKRN